MFRFCRRLWLRRGQIICKTASPFPPVECLKKLALFLLISCLFVYVTFLQIYQYRYTGNDEVPGWERNKSRIMTDYINASATTYTINIKNLSALEEARILIFVCSDPKNGLLRRSIRETWASNVWSADEGQAKIAVLFLLGLSADENVNESITEESELYEDMIVENFADTYNNLTLKSVFLLKYVADNAGHVPKYIMKVDDDVYINTTNLLKFVGEIPESEADSILTGKLYTTEEPKKNPASKWFMPDYIYPFDKYPHFLCGVGYLMSQEIALTLYNQSLQTDIVYIEDVFITGICAKAAGIKPKNCIAFRFFEHPIQVECTSVHSQLVLVSHHVGPYDMYKIHKELNACA